MIVRYWPFCFEACEEQAISERLQLTVFACLAESEGVANARRPCCGAWHPGIALTAEGVTHEAIVSASHCF